jgi:uncharacterized membrane protein
MERIKELKEKLINFISKYPNAVLGFVIGVFIGIFVLLFGIKLIIIAVFGVLGYAIGRFLERK